MKHIIEDPDFDGWDGKYVDTAVNVPSDDYDFSRLLRYMRKNNKRFEDLSKEEIEKFRFKD